MKLGIYLTDFLKILKYQI